MNAKEKFEKLGYNLKGSEWLIEYAKDDEHYFIFNKRVETVTIGKYFITLEELEAITQQVAELGWLKSYLLPSEEFAKSEVIKNVEKTVAKKLKKFKKIILVGILLNK